MSKRIGLVGENSVAFVKHLIKIWNEGNSAVLIDWRIPMDRIMELLIAANAKQCYIDQAYFKKTDVENGSVEFICYVNDQHEPSRLPAHLYVDFRHNYEHKEALILFSSGTTGQSKGIVLSHYSIQTNSDFIYDYMRPTDKDRMMIIKTIVHSSTLVGELLVALKYNIPMYISPSCLLPSGTLNWISQLGISILCLNPSLLVLLSRIAAARHWTLEELKEIYTSGSIASESVLRTAAECFPATQILNVYGLTEAGPRVTAQRKDMPPKWGSVGKPIGSVKISIRSLGNEEVQTGQTGAIFVHTPCRFTAYLSDDSQMDGNGWLNTGDSGYIDSDGDLYITGRTDAMICIGSHNVYPEQVENIITNHEHVDNCLVTSCDDILHGSVIVCKYTSDRELSRELRNYCVKHLAPYEIPTVFIRVDAILQTAGGKKKRKNKTTDGD